MVIKNSEVVIIEKVLLETINCLVKKVFSRIDQHVENGI